MKYAVKWSWTPIYIHILFYQNIKQQKQQQQKDN